jgi:predicted enzyme related to lactoylglutathione lyase
MASSGWRDLDIFFKISFSAHPLSLYASKMNFLAHFAINTDDVEVTRAFYEAVFGWKFNAYGPQGFYQIDTGGEPITLMGALQKRRALVPGVETRGFECTIAVESLDKTETMLRSHNAKIVLERSAIPQVGHLLFFEDPGGNFVGAIQFDSSAE